MAKESKELLNKRKRKQRTKPSEYRMYNVHMREEEEKTTTKNVHEM